VALGEREGGAAARFCEQARRLLRIRAHDVEIGELSTEQLVSDGAADEIDLFAGKHLANEIE
jgi:hypothetical protein